MTPASPLTSPLTSALISESWIAELEDMSLTSSQPSQLTEESDSPKTSQEAQGGAKRATFPDSHGEVGWQVPFKQASQTELQNKHRFN